VSKSTPLKVIIISSVFSFCEAMPREAHGALIGLLFFPCAFAPSFVKHIISLSASVIKQKAPGEKNAKDEKNRYATLPSTIILRASYARISRQKLIKRKGFFTPALSGPFDSLFFA
jgi:hypothetical protein